MSTKAKNQGKGALKQGLYKQHFKANYFRGKEKKQLVPTMLTKVQSYLSTLSYLWVKSNLSNLSYLGYFSLISNASNTKRAIIYVWYRTLTDIFH